MINSNHLFFLSIFMMGTVMFGFGQTAELSGYVKTKSSDQEITIATVSLLNQQNEIVYTVKVNNEFGEYRIDSITHGNYTLLVSAKGFKTRRITDFAIRAEHRLVKNVVLNAEFSRFSEKKEKVPVEVDYEEKERMIQYVMYSSLALVLVAVLVNQ